LIDFGYASAIDDCLVYSLFMLKLEEASAKRLKLYSRQIIHEDHCRQIQQLFVFCDLLAEVASSWSVLKHNMEIVLDSIEECLVDFSLDMWPFQHHPFVICDEIGRLLVSLSLLLIPLSLRKLFFVVWICEAELGCFLSQIQLLIDIGHCQHDV
jgi:hypothetical protein